MYRAALRTTARATRSAPRTALASTTRRYLSFGASEKPRTWKGAAVRWGLAIGAVYWYNTSPIFADELPPQTVPAPPQFSDADLPTVESVIEQKRKEAEVKAQKPAPAAATPKPAAASEEKHEAAESTESSSAAVTAAEPGSPEALEEEANQQGAFNPETGEINWDCPCLGGMAHGPCGEEFKAAFSCFVYSTEEPKGMDCIDKFQHMQDCFRKYPEIYGSELGDEDGDESPGEPAGVQAEAPASTAAKNETEETVDRTTAASPVADQKTAASSAPETPAAKPETSAPVITPQEAVDATAANSKSSEEHS